MGNFKFDKEVAKKMLAEFTGTAMVITLGCCVTCYTLSSGGMYSAGWGLAYLAAMQCFAFISGAHLNPAVSGCACILGVMPWQLFLLYLVCQLVGSIVGFGLAMGAAPKNMKNICLTGMSKVYNVEVWKGLLIEFFATSILLFAFCAIWDARSKGAYDSLAVRIGLIIGGLCLVFSGYTNCGLNFFRTLAPHLIQTEFDDIWVYFVGQLLAAVLVPVLWRFVIAEGEPEQLE